MTTDTASALRALEISADVLLMAKNNVDGVYDSDPEKNPDAKRYAELTYDKVIADRLNVMDTTAVVMCRDNQLPIRVFDLQVPGNLMRLIKGADVGTLVKAD